MLILVPPSEGKTAPPTGAPLTLDALSHPELGPVRSTVLAALEDLSRGDEERALAELHLGPRSREDLQANRVLRTAPAAPAAEVYTGVLFDRLGLGSLPAAARRRAEEHVLIVSALWGVLRPSDRIPAYRCPAGARLPGQDSARRTWAEPLARALPADQLVVDLRSGPYRELWRGPADAPTVLVGVVRESGGRRTVVSHDAKATRGAIGRALLRDRGIWSGNESPKRVARRIEAAGFTVELEPAGRPGTFELTVVERVD
ncbi:YaaA family protein [Patulibacter sp.]|uniref:YaaA family protein n=1 Tax=Patulibacter sp. TaxID=1912859 RepID=UPI0027220333|nr:peroxide stress protein YaaA [Patulibacter sp.]MDO9410334.1 peroxide stress protein YaaA [Patulibacter sp.]